VRPKGGLDLRVITPTKKHGKKIMVWGCFTRYGVGEIKDINGIMDTGVYQRILETGLLPTIKKFFPDGSFVFQQDNDPKHKAQSTKKWLADHGIKGDKLMEWPPQSPDLNPIENLWSELKRMTQEFKAETYNAACHMAYTSWARA